MPQHDDKHHKNKKIVVIEKVRDKYGSVIALKVVLYRRHDTENGKVWDMKRSHTFSAAFSRRAVGNRRRRWLVSGLISMVRRL